jgi:sulfopyruvate decarboxylase alpha subunit
MNDFPELEELPDYLVVKTHVVARSLRLLWRVAGGSLLITVREPRDAVASLMLRFGFPFDVALKSVEDSGACLVGLASHGNPLILRYQDRFMDREETIAAVARHLGVKVSTTVAMKIFHSLSREAVAAKIEELTEQGIFGPDATPERFDPQTHWHPNHLGNGETGKYQNVLSPRQQALVTLGTSEFCRAFGYSVEPPPGANKRRPSLGVVTTGSEPVMDMSPVNSDSLDWRDQIFAALKAAEIEQVGYVPDAGHARLIELIEADPAIRGVPLTTEEEGIALAAGAWLGGQRAALLMQSSGVGNCINMLSLAKSCRFPLVMLVTMRGEWAEFNPWQVAMGSKTQAALELMDVLVYRVEEPADAAETVAAALDIAFNGSIATAVLLSQRLIGAKRWVK